jgi:hypothetical protein
MEKALITITCVFFGLIITVNANMAKRVPKKLVVDGGCSTMDPTLGAAHQAMRRLDG